MTDVSEDELPDLATLLGRPKSGIVARRRSPRRIKQSNPFFNEQEQVSELSTTARQTRASPKRENNASLLSFEGASVRDRPPLTLGDIPALSRHNSRIEASASSNNSLARSPQHRSIGLTHVDSLLLPLSKVCLDGQPRYRGVSALKAVQPQAPSILKRSGTRKRRSTTLKADKLFLTEVVCADDDDSSVDEDDAEDTDLSGFVVADDVELSVHESSSDSDIDKRVKQKSSASPRKRKLQQGSRHRSSTGVKPLDLDFDEKHNAGDILSNALRGLNIDDLDRRKPVQGAEVIDLTSSPIRTHERIKQDDPNTGQIFGGSRASARREESINRLNDFDAILRFSPPPLALSRVTATQMELNNIFLECAGNQDLGATKIRVEDGSKKPPATPPRSPSKLKSPSKLLSPSKRAAQIPKSPQRQSLDGFWDLEAVNTWNDTYSPKKAPLASPKKNRFLEWLDSGDEDDETPAGLLNDSSDSLPSPCSSPRKSRWPQRSPEKAEKQRLVREKQAAKAMKRDFDSNKEGLAAALMQDLDLNVTSSELSNLSASTGGVEIVWSKTLRSTAGRANWRRTITKPTGSPVKGSSVPEDCKVQHYASIELATKVIDCESRLINTLAHEFCHLANFMVSNVRDQPHGASFKAWAVKVTKYLKAHENAMYRNVEVTTKHSYTIEHKYLWVCAGREPLDLSGYLPEVEDGCGAEYGRHSKSIDTDKHRCGRCKGALVQVRPKPRKVDPKRSSPRKALFQKGKTSIETVTDAVEVVDLED